MPGRRLAWLVGIAALVACAVLPRRADAHPPPFVWMADLSPGSRVGLDITGGTIDTDAGTARLAAIDVAGQFALASHVALVVRAPFLYVTREGEIITPELSTWALGNVALGLQVAATHRFAADRRVRYGVGVLGFLDTASSEDERGDATGVAAAWDVPGLGRYRADTTTVRVRGDVRLESGKVFTQAEILADRRMVADGDDVTDLGGAVGLGVATSHYLAFLAEVTLLSDTLYADESTLVSALDVGVRYHDPATMLGIRLYLPLDDDRRDADALGIGFDLGLRF